MTSVEHVRELLDHLGTLDDGRAVGSFLADKGVRGIPWEHAHCPLANYLKRELGLSELMDETTILVWPLVTKVAGVRLTNPPVVVEFVKMLDAFKFYGVLWPNLRPRSQREQYQPKEEDLPIPITKDMLPYLQPWLTGVRRPTPKAGIEVAAEREQASIPVLV